MKRALFLVLLVIGCGTRKAEVEKQKTFSTRQWDYRVQGPGDRVYFAAPRTPQVRETPGPVTFVRPALLEPSLKDTTIFRSGANGATMRIRFNERGEFEDAECICPPVMKEGEGSSEEGAQARSKDVTTKGRTNLFAVLLSAVLGLALGFYLRSISAIDWIKKWLK